MKTNIDAYWDEPTLLIYGLLGGFTLLNAEEIHKSLNALVNSEGGILTCINVLATLEGMQKIRTGGVWLDLRKYLHQLQAQNESETDEASTIISKVRVMADSEVDDRSVLKSNFTELLEHRELITEALHGCLEFDVRVLESAWIKQVLRDYLDRYRQNELFTPTASAYISYRQQLVAVTNLLESPTYPKTISRFLLPDNVRFLESLYDLVDRRKIAIQGFSDLTKSIAGPMFGATIDAAKKQSPRLVDTSRVRVEQISYDPASGVLNIVGQPVNIIGQKNKHGKKNESKQAQLMRLLFAVNTFPQAIPLRNIYTYRGLTYPQEIKRKARELVAEINRKINHETGVNDLLSCDDWRFQITPRYLKN